MEWYTPEYIIHAARAVFGEQIDLDPASCARANELVRARRFYIKEQDGLKQDWTCTSMWLNPPYGRLHGKGSNVSFQKLFAERLLAEYEQGNIGQAIILSLGNPNSKWFQPLFSYPLCFNFGTISFSHPDGTRGHFGFPLAFAYLGPNVRRFVEIFDQFGPVVGRIKIDLVESFNQVDHLIHPGQG